MGRPSRQELDEEPDENALLLAAALAEKDRLKQRIRHIESALRAALRVLEPYR